MITMIYKIPQEEADTESAWLKSIKVYPSKQTIWDWGANVALTRFAVIVPPEVALMIKLRHKLEAQEEFKQR